ncbi:glycosyltransferase [Azorhizobium caulinodans]|uniref:glycosyltransferase n=1 Tax=Azorhizobium caulinodans TaxID=7 RepID=UPI002FBEC228
MRIGVMSASITGMTGHDALSMVLRLRESGEDVVLFTDATRAGSHASVYDLADAPLLMSAGDLLIYHFNGPDEAAERILQRLKCEIVLRPHTLAQHEIDPKSSVRAARRQRETRAALARLRDRRVIEAWLPAGIILEEAERTLRMPCVRVPQFVETDSLFRAPTESQASSALTEHWLNILIVSPLAADAGIEQALRTFSGFNRTALAGAHLHIVGDAGGDDQYLRHLGGLAGGLQLAGSFTHHLDPLPDALASLYRGCDLFLAAQGTTPEAVTRALAFGLPVFALSSPTAADLAGEAAFLAGSPDKLANMAHTLVMDAFGMASAKRAALQRFNDHCESRHVAASLLTALSNTRRRLLEPIGEHADISGDWFGIPQAEELVRAAIQLAPDLRAHSLDGEDRRCDFIAWIISVEFGRSEARPGLLGGPQFSAYAAHLPVPPAAAHLGAEQRLKWFFDREVRSAFDLQSSASVAAYIEWSQEQAAA